LGHGLRAEGELRVLFLARSRSVPLLVRGDDARRVLVVRRDQDVEGVPTRYRAEEGAIPFVRRRTSRVVDPYLDVAVVAVASLVEGGLAAHQVQVHSQDREAHAEQQDDGDDDDLSGERAPGFLHSLEFVGHF